MNEPTAGLDPRFLEFVLSHQNFALMTLGKIPHPDTGATEINLDAAKMFIDQLEMIEGKTRGNLSAQESRLLGGALTQLRLAYVEASRSQPTAPATPTDAPQADATQADAVQAGKRFTKTY